MSTAKQLADLLSSMTVIDLSHTLEEDMQVVPSHSRFFHTLWDSHETGSIALVYQLVMNEHCGTHMDATAHFMPKGHPSHAYIDDVPVRHFLGRALTLDFSHYNAEDSVSVAEIQAWEAEHEQIQAGDFVLFHFGWDRYWVPRSASRDYAQRWPGLSGEAAQYLVERGIQVVGCDVIAIDGYTAPESPAHMALLGNGVNIVENLTNLNLILGESVVFLAPLKVKGGSGAPMRAVALK